MKIVSLFALLPLFVSGCASHSIDEQKAVGSWQVVSPSSLAVTYQLNADHTWSMGAPFKTGRPITFPPPIGYWRLDGNRLVMDGGLLDTNNVELTSLVTNNPASFRIASASETSMVLLLRDDAHSMDMTWKKINP